MYITMVIRRKTSLSSTCSSPGVSPCPSPNVHRNRSVSANASARNTPSITPKSTPSHSPGTTPPMSPRSTSSSSESWKTRLHSIRNSFLGTPRFHRRKIPGKNIENEAAWLALWVCIFENHYATNNHLNHRIGHVNEYLTMHYFGIPRHTQSMIAYMILTEYFRKFQWKIALWEFC